MKGPGKRSERKRKSAGVTPAPPTRARAGADIYIPVLYSLLFVMTAMTIAVLYFPIGDTGVEADFYADLVISAQKLWRGELSVSNYQYKGPVYSFALSIIHLFGGDWYVNGVALNLICAAAALILLYRLLLRIFNRPVAVLGMIYTSLFYEFFAQAHKASSDMLFFLLCILAIERFFSVGRSRRRLAWAGIVSALAFLTRYIGIFLPCAAIIALLFIDTDARGWKERLGDTGVYAAAFLAVCAPWFAAGLFETGQILSSRNLENVIREFYGGDGTPEMTGPGFDSYLGVIMHDPMYFAIHYLGNIPLRIWQDMRQTMMLESGIFLVPAVLRLAAFPLGRKQTAFIAFPFFYLLMLCMVFYLPRLSIPLIPAYYSLIFLMLFPGTGVRRTGLGKWISGKLPWPGRDGRKRWLISPFGIFLVAVLALMAQRQLRSIIKTERFYYARRPVYILDAARFLKTQEKDPGSATLMARKAHIAYYSGMGYWYYPKKWYAAADFIDYALDHDVTYIIYSYIEKEYYDADKFIFELGRYEGIERIYAKSHIVIYRLSEKLKTDRRARDEQLEAAVSRFAEAMDTGDSEAIGASSIELAELCLKMSRWELIREHVPAGIDALSSMAGSDTILADIATLRDYLALANFRNERYAEGAGILQMNIDFHSRRGNTLPLANTHLIIHRYYLRMDEREKALGHLKAAHTLYTAMGDSTMIKEAEKALGELEGEK